MGKSSFAFALAIFLTLMLVACGGSNVTPTVVQTANSAQTTAPLQTATATGGQTQGSAPTSAAQPPTAIADATATPVVLAQVTLRATATTAATRPPSTSAATSAATVAPTSGNSPTPAPTAPPFVNSSNLTGKLSIVGNDYAVYINKLDGSAAQAVLGVPGQDIQKGDTVAGQFPTWSPKGDKLAIIVSNLKAGTLDTADVVIINANDGSAFKLIDKSTTPGIFLTWSPDGNFLTVLADNGTALEFLVFDTTKSPPTKRKLLEGRAVYSSWANDSDTLYIHANGNSGEILARAKAKNPTAPLVSLGYSASGTTPAAGTLRLGGFRAPAFAADGAKIAYSIAGASSTDKEDIVIADVNGTEQGRIETPGLGAAFNWSPVSGQQLVVHSIKTQYQDVYDGLFLSDLSKPANNGKFEANKISSDEVIAFFWSPDGKKIAYVSVNDAGNLLYWNIYDLASAKSTRLVEWISSREQLQILTYFDQYGQTDSVWSPDSKALVFSGFDASARAGLGSVALQPDIFIVPAEGADVGKKFVVGKGRLAFWGK
jgi:TolB protein